MHIVANEILETIQMVDMQNLDVRTVTMGISLLDCIDRDHKVTCENIYNKIIKYGRNLVEIADKVAAKYGVPIVNKRVSVTPIAVIGGATDAEDYTCFAEALDKAAKEIGIDFIGGFSALVEKGFTSADKKLIASIPKALSTTDRVCSSVNVGSTKAGINLDAVGMMGKTVKELAELSKDTDGLAAAKFVVFTNAVSDNPFMAGAFHGVGEAEIILNLGISGPGVVRAALAKVDKKAPIDEITETIKKVSFKITRMGELVGKEVAKELGIDFGIVDLSLAPTPAVGDSVGNILEEFGLESVGAYGTTLSLAILNDAVKKGGAMAATRVGGLTGAFIPVSEDQGMIAATSKGYLTLEKLEAMTCVCSVGLDMIAIPGETPDYVISGIIGDEMAIGMVNSKTTAVRVIPVPGKTVGDRVVFGGLLGEADIMPVNSLNCSTLINRGGKVAPPIQAMKN
ncbi:PFL family protein [uncultured Ilyobacter sp.]|uniref:PFL family protein n=1 Tax=uncultured Ilyobacter sp. TaxID=544433 RepID=UPI002AA93299|nr:PFL family protein [uncultured Ilyobacter sp.]